MEGTGTLKWYNAAKGFGFITPEGAAPDDRSAAVFLHANVLPRSMVHASELKDGVRLKYKSRVVKRADGPGVQATKIEVL